jgi:RNA polymerase-associated protein CTR9
MAKLYVPVVDSTEVVVVDLANPPENAEELLDLLVSEAAPLSTWFDCARAYLGVGRTEGFDLIYETATSKETADEVEKYFGKRPTYEQIQFLTAKAALLMAQARDEKTTDGKTRVLSEARKLINQASTLDPNEQLVHLTSGLHSMARVRWSHP